MISLIIPTPLTSSPCIPAISKTTGPGFLERSTITGTLTVVLVCNFAISKSRIVFFPSGMSFPKRVSLLFDMNL